MKSKPRMTTGRRPRGRPREIGVIRAAEERVRIQLPPQVYDVYCQPALRRGWQPASLIREVLIRLARHPQFPALIPDFSGPRKSHFPPSV